MKEEIGISPRLKRLIRQRDKALCGDIKINVDFNGTAPAAGTGFSAKKIDVSITDAAGNLHDWFNKTITTSALAVTTVGDGTASQAPATTCVIENGKGSVEVTGLLTWAEGDTFTVEIPSTVIIGYTLSASLTITCTA